MVSVALWIDPARWAVPLVLFVLKTIMLLASAFCTLIAVNVSRVHCCGRDPEGARKKKEAKGEVVSDEDHEKALTADALEGILVTLAIIVIDYLLASWLLADDSGDGIVYSWGGGWCVPAWPLIRRGGVALFIWLSWVILVHAVFGIFVHIIWNSFYNKEDESSSTLPWILGLCRGLLRLVFPSYGMLEAKKHCQTLGIVKDFPAPSAPVPLASSPDLSSGAESQSKKHINSKEQAAILDEKHIVKAYKKLSLRWHPDRATLRGISVPIAEENFRKVKESRDVLIEEYVKVRARALFFTWKIMPVTCSLSYFDKLLLGVLWGGNSSWPLAWAAWTLLSHFFLGVILWGAVSLLLVFMERQDKNNSHGKTSQFGKGLLKFAMKISLRLLRACSRSPHSGDSNKRSLNLMEICGVVFVLSMLDWWSDTGVAWKLAESNSMGAGGQSRWFLYHEMLWLLSFLVTHICLLLLLVLFGPGSEGAGIKDNEEGGEALLKILWHRHFWYKVAAILTASFFDMFILGGKWLWTNPSSRNMYMYALPWNAMLCILSMAIFASHGFALLLCLARLGSSTGPIREATCAISAGIVAVVCAFWSLEYCMPSAFSMMALQSKSGEDVGLLAYTVSVIFQLLVPVLYCLFAVRHKRLEMSSGFLQCTVGALFRWTTLCCICCLWLATSRRGFAGDSLDDAAFVCALLFASAGNVITPSVAMPALLRNICLFFAALYHPFYRFGSYGVNRLILCSVCVIFQVVSGAAVHFFVHSSIKLMVSQKIGLATNAEKLEGIPLAWKILTGDLADEEFHGWFTKLGQKDDASKTD